MKQQSTGRHVAPLGHIVLVPSQTFLVLTSWCCLLSREAKNTNCIFWPYYDIAEILFWSGVKHNKPNPTNQWGAHDGESTNTNLIVICLIRHGHDLPHKWEAVRRPLHHRCSVFKGHDNQCNHIKRQIAL